MDLAKGVAKRLAEVGFEVKVLRSMEAVLAVKAWRQRYLTRA